MLMESILIQIINGLQSGFLFFLVASGLTIIFGVLNILNMTHGAFYMLGAYLMLTILMPFTEVGPLLFFTVAILVAVIVGLIGSALEFSVVRHIYGRWIPYQILLTFGLLLIFEDLVRLIWGMVYLSFSRPHSIFGLSEIFGMAYPNYNLMFIGVGVVIAVLLWLFLHYTRMGKLIRAAAAGPAYREMVWSLGYNVKFLFPMVFGLGASLAGLGGAIAGPLQTADPMMGLNAIVYSFAVIVIGGLGSLPGALIGSIIVGVSRAFAVQYAPVLEMAIVFIIMAIVLIFKPKGLFAKAER